MRQQQSTAHITRAKLAIIDWTPLHFAYDTGNTELVKVLLANGGDESAKSADGQVPKDRVKDATQDTAQDTTAVVPSSPIVAPVTSDTALVTADTHAVTADTAPVSPKRVSKFLAGLDSEDQKDPVVSQVSVGLDFPKYALCIIFILPTPSRYISVGQPVQATRGNCCGC